MLEQLNMTTVRNLWNLVTTVAIVKKEKVTALTRKLMNTSATRNMKCQERYGRS